MKHYTYILYSKTLDKFYIGSTSTSLASRLQKHLNNHSGYTSRAKDWEIVYFEEFNEKKFAIERELQIKNWKSRKHIVHVIDQ